MDVNSILAAIETEGGFDTSSEDVSSATLLSWANAARNEAVSSARSRRAILSLGPTVADQPQYAVPTTVVQIEQLRVDRSRPWLRVATQDLWRLQSQDASVNDAPGAFAPNFEADADAVVELWPVPGEAGLDIEALALVVPGDMIVSGAESTVGLPVQFHRPIVVHGAIAEGYANIKGDREGYAFHRQIWTEARDELKVYTRRRIGGGPTQIRIEG